MAPLIQDCPFVAVPRYAPGWKPKGVKGREARRIRPGLAAPRRPLASARDTRGAGARVGSATVKRAVLISALDAPSPR